MRIRCFTWVALLLLLGACNQAEGDVCQEDRDCADGLVCTLDDADRGFCQDPADVDRSAPTGDTGDDDLNEDPEGPADAGSAGRDAQSPAEEDAG